MRGLKMKLLTGLFTGALSIFTGAKAQGAWPTPNSTPAVKLTTTIPKPSSSNDLAWKLYRSFTKKGTNVFLSPASIETAVGLAFDGSTGETRMKAKKLLGLPLTEEKTAALVPSSYASFTIKDPNIKLEMHNAIWADPAGIDPTAEFVKHADHVFGAKVSKKVFGDGVVLSEEINGWVSKATNSMIPEIVSPNDLKGNHLAVLNAVYFLAKWDEEFEPFATRDGEFTTSGGAKVPAKLMNNTAFFPYAETADYQIANLPYKNKDYVMTILLPREGKVLADLEPKLTAGDFEIATTPSELWITLPKFKIDWGIENVVDELVTMGMPKVSPKAEFKALGAKDDVIIASVLHRAVVKVDEEGTEASAATAVMARAGSAPRSPPRFSCDRPFLFAIRDVKRNEILFLGRLSKP